MAAKERRAIRIAGTIVLQMEKHPYEDQFSKTDNIFQVHPAQVQIVAMPWRLSPGHIPLIQSM